MANAYYVVAGAIGVLALIVLWQCFGLGPRRRRGLKRVQRRLAAGAWQEALARVRKLRQRGRPSAQWVQRFNEAEAACLEAAERSALADNRFEDALGFRLEAAQVLGQSETEAKAAIQSAMLEEVRRLFSVTTLGDNKPVHEMIARVLQIQAPCREASFWQALCFQRGGESDRATTALQTARGQENGTAGKGQRSEFIDPPLYLGALNLRQGQAKESLKYLTEANRIDANCPIVTLQLGAAMIAAGGDTQLAVRALQRALGPKGLALWEQQPRDAWVEGFPEDRSFVRKLASAYPFVCPLWGGDLNILLQQGNLALARGYYKLAAYADAAALFGKVLQNGAPSHVVLRGLGLSLARLGKYDDAFKHLRIAHEMEEPKDRITAGYLALCGAMGKPTQPEDKARNILWALKVVTGFNAPGDTEWVALISTLFAAAREEQIPLTLDDQVYLCEHLWSVQDASPQAAQAYHHLQATFPKAVRPEYSWLFCRAAQQHLVIGTNALELFARTFAEPVPARAFFAEKKWDFEATEYAYLERAAALDPGHFPAALGPDYPKHGEEVLLAHSRQREEARQPDAALASAEILQKLAPQSPRALDRLAYLQHRAGRPEQAVPFLEAWHEFHPHDPRPLVRFAILLHQRGLVGEAQTKLREALSLCDGTRRARVAFLGARLILQNALSPPLPENNGSAGPDGTALAQAEELLHDCLRGEPDHADALWCLAAVRWLRGDVAGLADQVPAMKLPAEVTVRFRYFNALCQLAAHDYTTALETCALIGASQRDASSKPAPHRNGQPAPIVLWDVEGAYLACLAHESLEQRPQAAQDLQKSALLPESPSAAQAQALLGSIGFQTADYEQACNWWQMLDPKKRAAWKLGETLANTVFLTALQDAARGDFEKAAEKLRAAGKLGCRDRRLGPLLVLTLFKAGQKAVYDLPAV